MDSNPVTLPGYVLHRCCRSTYQEIVFQEVSSGSAASCCNHNNGSLIKLISYKYSTVVLDKHTLRPTFKAFFFLRKRTKNLVSHRVRWQSAINFLCAIKMRCNPCSVLSCSKAAYIGSSGCYFALLYGKLQPYICFQNTLVFQIYEANGLKHYL